MKKRINYTPNYQRNYIWNNNKAIKLIETILLNKEIPPLTVIEKDDTIEIIDGRQRYETILRFFNNEFALKAFGLSLLKPLNNLKYSELPPNVRSIFEEYKLKFITYKIEKGTNLSNEELDCIKRDLFCRYNYGMTALSKSEVARAKYLYDNLTILLRTEIMKDENIFESCVDVYLSTSKRKFNNRDKINLLLVVARELLSVIYIPIIGVKNVKFGTANLEKYYEIFVKKENINDKKNEFLKISQKVIDIKIKLKDNSNPLCDNILFFKSVYWMLSILYKVYPTEFYNFNINKFYHYIEDENNGVKFYDNYKNLSSNHIINRHMYVKKYLCEILKLDLDFFFQSIINNRKKIVYKSPEKLKNTADWYGIKNNKQIITIPESLSVAEIVKLQQKNRFIVRPVYQRSEVRSLEKASKIIESIILGIKLPPIYVVVRENDIGLKEYLVIDGQQRLISILSFLGEQLLDDNYDFIKSVKKKYALTGLRDLEYLNGKKFIGDNSLSDIYKDLILDYEIDIIQIEEKNQDFDPVDMFLRLNENPCNISKNSFEMWNSFEITKIINRIKEISKYTLFNQKNGKVMKEEELVTILAYMDKERINLENCHKIFKIHLYTENSNKSNERIEVKISIMNKASITHYLELLEPNSVEEEKFFNCLNNVQLFVKKLDILVEDNYDKLIKILNPYIDNIRKGSMKDFYLLWLILENLDNHILKTYKSNILNDLSAIFKLMKNMPLNKDVDYFLSYIKEVIKKYIN